MELGFWTYGLIRLLDRNSLNQMFLGPRSQSQRIFWDNIILLDSCYDSGENEILSVKVRTRVLVLWLHIFLDPSPPNVVFRLQTPNYFFFWDIKILSELFYNHGEKDVLLLKIEARVLDLWLYMFFGPTDPNVVFRFQNPK